MTDEGSLLPFANQSRKDDFLTDVTIKVENLLIRAHRLVLACYSGFFRTMFDVNMKERYKDVIEIKGFNGHLIEELIEFMYTGIMSVDNDNVMPLLEATDYLQHDQAMKLCFEYLQNNIAIENWFDILSAAMIYRNTDFSIQYKIFVFISKHLNEILIGNDFKFLQRDAIASCLANLGKFGVKHKHVYEVLLTWIKYDEDSRKVLFVELFKLLPFTRLSTDFLETVVLKEKLVEENADCSTLIQKVLTEKLVNDTANGKTKLLSVGGQKTGSKVLNVYIDSLDSSMEKKYPDLPVQICAHSAVLHNNILYCIGGCVNAKSSNFSRRVFALNLNSSILE